METYPEGLGRSFSIVYGKYEVLISLTHRTYRGGLAELAAFLHRNSLDRFLFEHEGVTYTAMLARDKEQAATIYPSVARDGRKTREYDNATVCLVVDQG